MFLLSGSSKYNLLKMFLLKIWWSLDPLYEKNNFFKQNFSNEKLENLEKF